MKNIAINFSKGNGLIPVIIQEEKTGNILMLGFMDKQALEKTKKTGFVYFWSRTKKRLWLKGEESGNKFLVKNMFIDCDNDTILIKVNLLGKNACHTGNYSCFYQKI